MSRIYIWFPNIDREIEKLVKTCETCEKLSNSPNKSLPHPWDWPNEPMDCVHIDFFEFENSKFLAMVDSYSKWIEIKVANSWKTDNTIKTLKLWFSQFDIPKQLVSDNGVHFTSTEFISFIEKTEINHIRTAIYHQSSNGQVERYVQTIKQALIAEKQSKNPIDEKINNFSMSYQSTPHTTTSFTSAQLFIGRNISTKIDLIKPSRLIVKKKSHYENEVRSFSSKDNVIVRFFGGKENWKNGKILEKLSFKMCLVSVHGKCYRRHIDQIKRSCSVATDFRDSDLWDTVKTSLDERNIKANENQITMINRYPQGNRRSSMRFGQDEWISNEKGGNVIL